MVRVKARVEDGDSGYEYTMQLPCKVDLAGMTDLQRLEAFLAHRKKTCPCYKAG